MQIDQVGSMWREHWQVRRIVRRTPIRPDVYIECTTYVYRMDMIGNRQLARIK